MPSTVTKSAVGTSVSKATLEKATAIGARVASKGASAANASRSLAPSDVDQVVPITAAATLTIPTDATLGITDPSASVACGFYLANVSSVTVTAGSGVTLRGTPPAMAQYKTVGIVHVAKDEWAWL